LEFQSALGVKVDNVVNEIIASPNSSLYFCHRLVGDWGDMFQYQPISSVEKKKILCQDHSGSLV
jgi:hypothetical protein